MVSCIQMISLYAQCYIFKLSNSSKRTNLNHYLNGVFYISLINVAFQNDLPLVLKLFFNFDFLSYVRDILVVIQIICKKMLDHVIFTLR